MYVIDVARKPITFRQCDERVPLFAPTWDLVMEGHRHEIPWDEYVERYTQQMRNAYRDDPEMFHRFARMLDNLHLACWCEKKDKRRKANGHCHTHVLRKILEAVRTKLNGTNNQ